MRPTDTMIANGDAARMLGIRPQTLREWRGAGTSPPYVRYGGPRGRVYYRVDVLTAWLDARTHAHTAAEAIEAHIATPTTKVQRGLASRTHQSTSEEEVTRG